MICEEYEKATGNKYPALARGEDAKPLVRWLEKKLRENWLQIQVMGDMLYDGNQMLDPDEWIALGKQGAELHLAEVGGESKEERHKRLEALRAIPKINK